MPSFLFNKPFCEEAFEELVDFFNSVESADETIPVIVFLDSPGGDAVYMSPIATLLEMYGAELHVLRASSAAFFLSVVVNCPVTVGMDTDGMIHQCVTQLPYPAPKTDSFYKFTKESRNLLEVKLTAIAKDILSDAEFKEYCKQEDVYISADRYAEIIKKVQDARESEQPSTGQADSETA